MGVAADLAKPLVGVGDVAVQVGDAHDGVLVQGKILVGQVVVLGEQALGHDIQGLPQRLNFCGPARHRKFGTQRLVQRGCKLGGFAQGPHVRAQQQRQQAQCGHTGHRNHQQSLGPNGAGSLLKAVQPVAHPDPAQCAAICHRVPGGNFSGIPGQKVPLGSAWAVLFNVNAGFQLGWQAHLAGVETRRPKAILVDHLAQRLACGVSDQNRKNAGNSSCLNSDRLNTGQIVGGDELGVDRGQVLGQSRHLCLDGGARQIGLLFGGVGTKAQNGGHDA